MADDYRRQGFELERRIFELDNKCATLKTEKPGNATFMELLIVISGTYITLDLNVRILLSSLKPRY